MLAAIRAAAKALNKGDLFFMTYSGHGGQVADASGDEPDKQDETWCLFDGQLIDDELYHELSKFAAGVRMLVLSDSCHSGTVTRARVEPPAPGTRVKLMPPDVALRVYEQHQTFYDDLQRGVAGAAGKAPLADPDAVLATLSVQSGRVQAIARKFKAAVILISGCQDNQVALDGDHNGAFTGQLRRIWNSGKFKGNHPQFHAQIVAGMPASQTPNLFLLGPAGAFAALPGADAVQRLSRVSHEANRRQQDGPTPPPVCPAARLRSHRARPAPLTPAARARAGQRRRRPVPAGRLPAPRASFDVGPAARGAADGGAETVHAAADRRGAGARAGRRQHVHHQRRARCASRCAQPHPSCSAPDGEILFEQLRAEGAARRRRGLGEAVGGLVSKVFTLVGRQGADAIIARRGCATRSATTPARARRQLGRHQGADVGDRDAARPARPGLYRWVGASGEAERPRAGRPAGRAPTAGGADRPMLVFVHGTGSSTLGSFGDLRSRRPRPVGRARAPVHRRHLRLRAPHAVARARSRTRCSWRARCPRGAQRQPGVALARRAGRRPAVPGRLRRADRRLRATTFRAPATPIRPRRQRVLGELDDAHAEQREQLRELAAELRAQAARGPALRARAPARRRARGSRAATSTSSCRAC